MNFTELCNEVYSITNRPDLVNETKVAVRTATLKAHQSDFYPKDLHEVAVRFDTAAYIQSLSYKEIVPRWRALKYLRKLDSTGTVPGIIFSIVSPDNVLDDYALDKENICYLAGLQLEIKSNTEFEYLLLGCYVHPDITENSYLSWIADEHPYCIVLEAAAKVFKMIGFDEQATQLARDVMEQIALLRLSQLQAQGY